MDGMEKFDTGQDDVPEERRWYFAADELSGGTWHCLRCAALVSERDDHDDWHDRVLPELIARTVQR